MNVDDMDSGHLRLSIWERQMDSSSIVLCVCPRLPLKGPSFTWYNPNNHELTPLAISVEQPGDSAWEAPQS